MDAFLERRWFHVFVITGVVVVLSAPEEPSALAEVFYLLALAAFPFSLRARSLHAGPPRNPWRTAVGRWTTAAPSRWLLVAGYAAVAAWVSWSRYELSWHAPVAALVAGGAAYAATSPLPWLVPTPPRP